MRTQQEDLSCSIAFYRNMVAGNIVQAQTPPSTDFRLDRLQTAAREKGSGILWQHVT